MDRRFIIFDIETFPNIFTLTAKVHGQNDIKVFEISTRKNQRDLLIQWLEYWKTSGTFMVGFNNLGFDYPLLHELLNSPFTFDFVKAYQICMQIINSGDHTPLFSIPYKDRLINQIDLFKLNHFDNANRRTSLKALQFAMRSESVEDLPFEPGLQLTSDQMDTLIHYNIHDVTETEKFFDICKPAIDMRFDLLEKGFIKGDVLNFSDVKIGEQYLVNKIGRHKCYNGSKPKQTFRSEVQFKNVILPSISFETETCNQVLEWFKKIVIYPMNKDKGSNPKLTIPFANLDFVFGLGGLHASVESKIFKSNKTHVIIDIDVAGMYPAIAIADEFYPEHLGKEFVTHYKQLKFDRDQHKKGTTLNKVLKLSGNGVYGKSNDIYSCFFDPKYTFSVTVNGQLKALQIAEKIASIPGIQMIQANTDGITAFVPRNLVWMFDHFKTEWEKETRLVLESFEYKAMWIRDVNNYIGLKNDGSVKLKGAYWYPKTPEDYEGVWNKDFSMLVVQKCAEFMLLYDEDPANSIRAMTDKFDFMKRYKSTGKSQVYIGSLRCPKTARYYVSTQGETMFKIDPARGPEGSFKRKSGLQDKFYNEIVASIPPGQWDSRIHTSNKSVYAEVKTSIESGYKVKMCNKASDFNWNDVDFDYYINETNKLYIKG